MFFLSPFFTLNDIQVAYFIQGTSCVLSLKIYRVVDTYVMDEIMKVATSTREWDSELLWCNFNHSISNFIFSFVSGIRTQKPYLYGLTKSKGGKLNLNRRSTSVYKKKCHVKKSSLIYSNLVLYLQILPAWYDAKNTGFINNNILFALKQLPNSW